MNPVKEFTEALPPVVKQTGIAAEYPAEVLLKAGSLKVTYSNGALRYISTENHELIRMIYSAVRDKNWLTIPPLVVEEKIEAEEKSFKIFFKCLYSTGDISFSASYLIEGRQDSSITLTMEGKAMENSLKNRIGWCVLHPVEECAGENCLIEHTDGSTEQSVFPEDIAPHQVFREIKSMIWMSNRIRCRIDFEGDIFETEDQRNWTDASFKTYSTPLSIPFPVTLEKDKVVNQRITVRAYLNSNTQFTEDGTTILKLIPEETLRMPSVGICRSSRSLPLTKNEIKYLRAVRFDHYRVDILLYESDWKKKAKQAVIESTDLGYPMELALFFDNNITSCINDFLDWYSGNKLNVSSIILYHREYPSTSHDLASEVIPLLKKEDPDVKTGIGTNANFAQLNRIRPDDAGNDFICFSIHPQEHASDNITLTENLKAQEYSIRSAQKFAGNKGIIVSPVTIQRRFNANNTFIEIPWTGRGIPPQVDSRLMSLFGACWTAGSLKYLCEAGAESISFYETAGERGIIQGDSDSRWPLQFKSVKGMIFPLYHVFRFLLANKSLALMKSISSRPLIADCLALTDGNQARILLVNYTAKVQPVSLDCCSGLFRIRTLSSESYSEAASNNRWSGIEDEKIIKSHSTFDLKPYSINFIEGWRRH
jgi:D-apionolactonase